MTVGPFEFVKSICEKTVDLTDQVEDYNPFLANRALSMFSDTVLLANEMNMRFDCPKRQQYLFLLNTIRRKKRYSGKWPKKFSSENIKSVMKYYGYSEQKAMEVLKFMTEEQVKFVNSIVNTVSEDKNE